MAPTGAAGMRQIPSPQSSEEGDRILLLWRLSMTIIGLVAAIASCASAYFWTTEHWLQLINAIVWTFGPPVWFMFEYMVLFSKYGKLADKDDLKYGQGLATKFWAGVGALLVVIYKGM